MSRDNCGPLPGQMALFAPSELRVPNPESLTKITEEALGCKRCAARAFCKQVVVGEGRKSNPLIAFVGEAPGPQEDAQNRPFTGKGLELIGRMLDAMNVAREDVFLCNVVGCRPPDKRPPNADEIGNCNQWLIGQLRAVQPYVIVALGSTAGNVLVGPKKPESLEKLREGWHKWEGIPLKVTFHPNHLLRVPLDKPFAWKDMQEVTKVLQVERG